MVSVITVTDKYRESTWSMEGKHLSWWGRSYVRWGVGGGGRVMRGDRGDNASRRIHLSRWHTPLLQALMHFAERNIFRKICHRSPQNCPRTILPFHFAHQADRRRLFFLRYKGCARKSISQRRWRRQEEGLLPSIFSHYISSLSIWPLWVKSYMNICKPSVDSVFIFLG